MGFMGKMDTYRYTTLPFYYALPFTVEPFGVCARTQKTRDLAEKLGYTFVIGSPEELISYPEVDIVDISTPNIAHRNQLLLALQEGKAIYCEKPLVANIQKV